MSFFIFKITCLVHCCVIFFSLSAATKPSVQRFEVSCEDYQLLKRIPSQKEIVKLEDATFNAINHVRTQFGLKVLTSKKELVQLSRDHSKNMATNKVAFGHDGFQLRSEKVLKNNKCDFFGENVAYTYLAKDPIQVSVEGWMKSPLHRENILGDFDQTGIGICYSKEGKCYLTQIFARAIKNVF